MARRGENIYKRKDGRYEGRYIKYYDISGKAVYGYIYSKSYSDIKEKLTQCKTEKRQLKTGSNTKFSDWLITWINSQVTLKPTSKRVYKSHIENNIIPLIGDIPLKKISKDILQNFINNLNLSSETVKTVYTILKSALCSAEEKGFFYNDRGKIKLPKNEKSAACVLTISEQRRLECFLTEKQDIGILLSLYTGLRIGEVCALKWSDISFENNTLTVNGTQTRGEKGIEVTSPKSKSSKREIPIPLFLLKILREIVSTSEFVIMKNGKPFDVRTYRRYFKSVLKKATLPDIKYHSLRHTFATRALEVGMDYKTLSEILGHSSVGITLDLYAHSLKEHKIKEMNKMSEVFKN